MTTQEKAAALAAALRNHEDNRAAVRDTQVPRGLEPVVTAALARALSERLVRIFDGNA